MARKPKRAFFEGKGRMYPRKHPIDRCRLRNQSEYRAAVESVESGTDLEGIL
jgi:hypothetical protein